jgi:hypothetical protein
MRGKQKTENFPGVSIICCDFNEIFTMFLDNSSNECDYVAIRNRFVSDVTDKKKYRLKLNVFNYTFSDQMKVFCSLKGSNYETLSGI